MMKKKYAIATASTKGQVMIIYKEIDTLIIVPSLENLFVESDETWIDWWKEAYQTKIEPYHLLVAFRRYNQSTNYMNHRSISTRDLSNGCPRLRHESGFRMRRHLKAPRGPKEGTCQKAPVRWPIPTERRLNGHQSRNTSHTKTGERW